MNSPSSSSEKLCDRKSQLEIRPAVTDICVLKQQADSTGDKELQLRQGVSVLHGPESRELFLTT